MNPVFAAEFLARTQRGESITSAMSHALMVGIKSMSAAERLEFCCEWYALDPDGIERAMKDVPEPGRSALHDQLIRNYAERKHRP